MTAKRRRADALPVPQTETEAHALLAELGHLDRQIREHQDALAEEIRQAKARVEANIEPLKAEADEKFLALKAWFESNREELPKGRKSLDWPEGTLGYRKAQPAVKPTETAEATIDRIKGLRLKGARNFLNITTRLNKPAILQACRERPDLAETIKIRIDQPEEFFAKPAEADHERTAKVKAQKTKARGKEKAAS